MARTKISKEERRMRNAARMRARYHAGPAKEYQRQWREKNRERHNANARAWRAANADKARAATRVWLKKNKERRAEYFKANAESIRQRERKRYVLNPERGREKNRKYHQGHVEERSRYNKAWARANPEKVRASCRNRRARILSAEGSHTIEDIAEILRHQHNKCAGCAESLDDTFQIDHIKPLSKGGSNYRRNIQILCPRCNRQKKDRDPAEFYRRRGKLI